MCICTAALLFTFCLVRWFFSSLWVEAGTKQRHQRELFDFLFVGWGHTFKHTHTLDIVSTESKRWRPDDVIHLFSCSDQSMRWLVHVIIISYYNSDNIYCSDNHVALYLPGSSSRYVCRSPQRPNVYLKSLSDMKRTEAKEWMNAMKSAPANDEFPFPPLNSINMSWRQICLWVAEWLPINWIKIHCDIRLEREWNWRMRQVQWKWSGRPQHWCDGRLLHEDKWWHKGSKCSSTPSISCLYATQCVKSLLFNLNWQEMTQLLALSLISRVSSSAAPAQLEAHSNHVLL